MKDIKEIIIEKIRKKYRKKQNSTKALRHKPMILNDLIMEIAEAESGGLSLLEKEKVKEVLQSDDFKQTLKKEFFSKEEFEI